MQATVKYQANKPMEYPHGPRINVVVKLPDGSEKKIWGNPDDQFLTGLVKGQQVQVFTDRKGNLQLDTSSVTAQPPRAQVAPAQAAAPRAANGAGFTVPPEAVRHNMLEYIDFSAGLFKYCFDVAGEKMQDAGLKDEDLRAIATTLFISTSRRYNLQ